MIDKIQELVLELNEYRNSYYNLNKSIISDKEYDKLFDELKNLEDQSGYVLSNSPTRTVGYEVKSKLEKVRHTIPLRSLDKTKNINVLADFIGNKPALIELKGDGLTVELVYENTVLVEASTRGNGEIGEDITHNVKTFKNVPLTINYEGRIKIVGEAIIHKNDFEELNSKLSENEKYATPRNLAAGSVRQLDSEECSKRNMYFYAFSVLESDVEIDSKYEQLRWLDNLGFTVINYVLFSDKITNNRQKQLERTINLLKEMANNSYIPIDGMVVTFDSNNYSKSLGETSHHPLHSLAFKFEDDVAETTLKEIEWSVGRTGAITPVAIFDTVELDGTQVNRASVHNLSIIEDLELGIGDSIGVIKANMIIPQIQENYTRSGNLEIPNKCPSCGENTIVEQIKDSKVLMCLNNLCPAKLIKSFSHFVSRDAMNIEGLSEATLDKFLQKGFIKTFTDIYSLEKYRSEIIKLDGFGVKSYNNLIDSIEKSKQVNMVNFIYALGINQIGLGGAKRLAKHFNHNIMDFILAVTDLYDFSKVEDFGDTTSREIHKYFSDYNNRIVVSELCHIFNFITPVIQNNTKDVDMKDLVFVVTGDFVNFKPRKKLEQLIESRGGKLSSSVSSKTNYLITNDTTSGTKKNQDAIKYGVEILDEEQFIELFKIFK